MKKTLLALTALAALLAACGGENQTTDNAAEETTPAAASTAAAMTPAEEARAYVEENFSEERLHEIYVESAAINKAAVTAALNGRDPSALTAEEREEMQRAAGEIIVTKQQEMLAQFEITPHQHQAVMNIGTEREWYTTLAERIEARAQELAAQYSSEN